MQSKGRWAFDIEEWKPIINFEDRYEVSSLGRIRSIPFIKQSKNKSGNFSFTTKEKILKLFTNIHQYLNVDLRKVNLRRRTSVHRLVAEAFLPNTDNLPQVNHIDGNKQNNNILNLEWCTAQNNVIHSYETGLACNKEESHSQAILSHELVFKIAKMHHDGLSYRDISSILGIKYHTVWSVINKRNWIESYQKALEAINNG